MMNTRTNLMRDLMYKFTKYNWTFCYSRSGSRTRDTFKDDFPIAYEKVMSGETQAIEKQIAKKPITGSYQPTLCPNCKTSFSESLGDGYYSVTTSCHECGQKLDWS